MRFPCHRPVRRIDMGIPFLRGCKKMMGYEKSLINFCIAVYIDFSCRGVEFFSIPRILCLTDSVYLLIYPPFQHPYPSCRRSRNFYSLNDRSIDNPCAFLKKYKICIRYKIFPAAP